MKKVTIVLTSLILFLLAGCSLPARDSADLDQAYATGTAVQLANDASQADMRERIIALESKVKELEGTTETLTSERDSALTELSKIKLTLDEATKSTEDAKTKVTKAEALANKYKSLFLQESGDREGEFIFCDDAFVTSFSYIDKVSMRTEMIKYLAKKQGYNQTSISSEHQWVWSNVSDGIIKLNGGGYMYPYLVAFEDTDFGRYNYVFDFTFSCFLDFPRMEREFLAVK